jgi:hypothetical protein
VSYATLRPRLEILEVLASIAAYQDSQWNGKGVRWGRAGAWCVVRQEAIVAWWSRMMKRYGYQVVTMCRRTLNYQLAGLRRDRYLTVEQRHRRRPGKGHRAGELDLRPSLYKFTTRGQLWIKRRQGWVENPIALSAVQTIAQSGYTSSENSRKSLSSAVDKTHSAGGGKSRGARILTSSSTHSSSTRPEALVRKGTAARPGLATTRSAPRSARKGRARTRRG